MASDIVESNDVLVLSDEDGNMYALPRPVVERHRLSAEQKADIERQIGEDVSGFQMQSPYMMEKMAGMRQSEMLREADQARLARAAGGSAVSSEGGSTGGGIHGIITGVWRTLPFLRPASGNA